MFINCYFSLFDRWRGRGGGGRRVVDLLNEGRRFRFSARGFAFFFQGNWVYFEPFFSYILIVLLLYYNLGKYQIKITNTSFYKSMEPFSINQQVSIIPVIPKTLADPGGGGGH